MIKQFSIFKTKEKKSPNSPDYSISLKVNDKFATVGAGWIKEAKDGTKYISCKLSDGYQDIKGFSITRDTGLTEEDKEFLKSAREAENKSKNPF